MIVYIAGKITGDSEYAVKFSKSELKLNKDGHIVLNPAALPEGMRPADYMRICFAMIESADVVYFLDGYRQSRGAMVEWEYCQYVGKQTAYEGTL